ncbi:MAG: hypothetical protein ACFFAY_11835 [Promethearchaeota archaeon]
MDRKMRNIGYGILIIGILSVGTLVVINFTAPTKYLHFERVFSQSELTSVNYVSIIIHGLVDCELSLQFEDNTDLMYRIDVELYDVNQTLHFQYLDYTASVPGIGINAGDNIGSTTRVKSMDIVLGTKHPYRIIFFGDYSENVTADIEYSNGANLGGGAFAYTMPGNLELDFDENVDPSEGGLEMEIGLDSSPLEFATVNIDLPDEMDGYAAIRASFESITTSGWVIYDEDSVYHVKHYRTAENPQGPLLNIWRLLAGTLVANLHD